MRRERVGRARGASRERALSDLLRAIARGALTDDAALWAALWTGYPLIPRRNDVAHESRGDRTARGTVHARRSASASPASQRKPAARSAATAAES